MPVPFKSPSAVLQYHVNPEHAAHHAAVKSRDDVGTNDVRLEVDNNADLPVKSVP